MPSLLESLTPILATEHFVGSGEGRADALPRRPERAPLVDACGGGSGERGRGRELAKLLCAELALEVRCVVLCMHASKLESDELGRERVGGSEWEWWRDGRCVARGQRRQRHAPRHTLRVPAGLAGEGRSRRGLRVRHKVISSGLGDGRLLQRPGQVPLAHMLMARLGRRQDGGE